MFFSWTKSWGPEDCARHLFDSYDTERTRSPTFYGSVYSNLSSVLVFIAVSVSFWCFGVLVKEVLNSSQATRITSKICTSVGG